MPKDIADEKPSGRKMKPMSLSIEPEMKKILDDRAEARGQKTSDFVRRLINCFGLDRDDVKPVVLQIPKDALASREALEGWLGKKTNALVNQFFPAEVTPCKIQPPDSVRLTPPPQFSAPDEDDLPPPPRRFG